LKERIAIYVPNLKLGGAEKVCVSLANEFIEKGYIVDLLLTVKEGVYINQISKSVNIFELSGKKASLDFFFVIKYLIKFKPQIILGTLTHINLMVLLVKRFTFTKTKFFISEHSLISKYNNLNSNNKYNKLIKWLYPSADGIIAVSNEIRNDLFTLTDSNLNIKVIYNPVISNEMENLLSQIKMKTNNRRVRFSDYYLYVGRLEKEKNILELLNSIIPILKNTNEKFLIIGEGTLSIEIKKIIKQNQLQENIILLGFIEQPYDYMYAAKVLILPSLFEGFGNVAIEAFYCKTDVIISDSALATINILSEATTVVTFDPKKSESLKTAIDKVQTQKKGIELEFFEQFKGSIVADRYIEYFRLEVEKDVNR